MGSTQKAVQIQNSFSAIADSTRRQLLDLVRENGPMRAGDLAKQFPEISRPAVSKHLRILRETGIFVEHWQGRECWYEISPSSLRVLHEWISKYDIYWSNKLQKLKHLAEEP